MAVIKIGRGDYVMDPYTRAIVRHDLPRGFVSLTLRTILHAKRCWFFGFLQLATAKAPGRILMQNTPKLAVLRKVVPFRGREHKI